MSDDDPLEQSVGGAPVGAASTLALAHRAQRGDTQALDELFRRFQEPLHRIVRIRMGAHLRRAGALESVDIVQQAFMKASSKLAAFEVRTERDVLAWLAAIAENQLRDEYAKVTAAKRDGGPLVHLEALLAPRSPDSSLSFEPADAGTRPEACAERHELQRIVDEAIQELPEGYREVILLRDFARAAWPDVAVQLGTVSVRAAQSLHYRAKARLSEILARQLPPSTGDE